MAVDYEKTRIITRLADSLKDAQGLGNNIEPEKLEELIKMSVTLSKAELSDEEYAEIKRELTYKYQIYTTPGESILSDYEHDEWYTKKKKDIVPRFWNRYKDYLIDEKQFNPNVISTLGDDTLDMKLMNYLGNPDSETDFLKRGLIIGDVQSGKTSTYIGLMCKAADAGYKVFILLAGTIESLRQQTQERVEEGFIGIDISADVSGGKRVGVGNDGKPIMAMSLTSRLPKGDFTGKSDKIAVSLQNKDAVVFVIKKNTTVLKKLTDWLVTLNADPVTHKIDAPMLLIDDEADNASINTGTEKEDPTKINKLIRQLVSVFRKSNYVGFTATPFANVFIDPETTEEMETHDLFPEDFIVALPTPSDYIGANRIFPEGSQYHSQLIYIKDAGRDENDGKPFYFKHKKDWDDILPESLTDSIYAFYIANTIRDLRGHSKAHRSMLINISRFIKVQQRVKQKVELIHSEAYTAIKYHITKNFDESMKNSVLRRIYAVWEEYYHDTEFSWALIAGKMFSAIEDIQIKVVNSSNNSEKLEYPKDDSLRVIAIGGLALSRGLTLEGLVTSYFYRNTCTYDVLMQMGRWFGYRRGYDDLFRIWTDRSSARWYAQIAEATDKLKIDMSTMRDNGQKPKNFGIRVRNNSAELNITARNKMRNTTDGFEFEHYFGSLIETPYLCPEPNKQKENYLYVSQLVEYCVNNGYAFEQTESSGKHYVIRNVPKLKIAELVSKLNISKYSALFDTEQISPFISDTSENTLDLWDIAFMDGKKSDDPADVMNLYNHKIFKVKRNNCVVVPRERLKIGQRGKLGGPSDGITGIADSAGKTRAEIINSAKEEYKKDYYKAKGEPFEAGRTFPSDTWFRYVSDRKPLLMIYFIDVSDEKIEDGNRSAEIEKFRAEMDGIPATGFAIGFPRNDSATGMQKSKYKVNIKYNYFEQYEMEQEGCEE